MPKITVGPDSDGGVEFRVAWSEPTTTTFQTRAEAEAFAANLRLTGRAADADGTCPACSAHHTLDHRCGSCTADLGLRVGFLPGANPTLRRIVDYPDEYLIAREQHRIRVEQATRARTLGSLRPAVAG